MNLIFIILLIVFAVSGWQRGFLREGRYFCGIVIGILATPILAPAVESLIQSLPIRNYMKTGIPQLSPFTSYTIRILAFTLTAVLIRKGFNMLTDIDVQGSAKTVDKGAGCVFSIVKLFVLIWIIDFLLTKNTLLPTTPLSNTLNSSPIYNLVSSYNPLYNMLHI